MDEEISSLKARANEPEGMENKFLKDEQSLHGLYEAGIIDEEGRFIDICEIETSMRNHNSLLGMVLF